MTEERREQNPYAPPADGGPPSDDRLPHEGGIIAGGRGVEAERGYAWIKEGYGFFKQSPWLWIAMFVVQATLLLMVGRIPYAQGRVGLVLNPLFTAGYMIGCAEVAAGRPLQFGHLFAGFTRRGSPIVLVGLIHVAYAELGQLVITTIFHGSYLARLQEISKNPALLQPADVQRVAIPFGITLVAGLPAAMAVYFAPALIALDGRGPLAAIKDSFSGCLKNVLPYVVMILTVTLFSVLSMATCGLGLLVLMPSLIAATYCAYRDIFYDRDRAEHAEG